MKGLPSAAEEAWSEVRAGGRGSLAPRVLTVATAYGQLRSHGAVEAGRGDCGVAPRRGGPVGDRRPARTRSRCAGRQPCRLRGLSLSASPGNRDGRDSGALRAGPRRARGPRHSAARRTGRGPRHPAHARPTGVVVLLAGSRRTRTAGSAGFGRRAGHAPADGVGPGSGAVHPIRGFPEALAAPALPARARQRTSRCGAHPRPLVRRHGAGEIIHGARSGHGPAHTRADERPRRREGSGVATRGGGKDS